MNPKISFFVTKLNIPQLCRTSGIAFQEKHASFQPPVFIQQYPSFTMKHFHFTRSARHAIALLCLFIFALLFYKHLSHERQLTIGIEDLQTRIATLERTINTRQHSTPAAYRNSDETSAQTGTGSSTVTSDKQQSSYISRQTPGPSRPAETTSHYGNAPSAKNSEITPSTHSAENVRESSDRNVTTSSGNYVAKFKTPQTVELNTADSLTLIRIPGIGAATAGAILRYRSRLGGYTSARQVAEAARWTSDSQVETWCRYWLTADSSLVIPLKINRADFSTLLRHPYLSYTQVCAISDLRRTHGRIRSRSDLKLLTEFSETDLARLTPYLSFQ